MIRFELLLFLLSIFSGNLERTFGANILITEDLASPSHQIWNYAFADALVARGHNVTILGPKTISLEGHEKFHRIALEGLYETIGTYFDTEELTKSGNLENLKLMNEYPIFSCDFALNTQGFRTLMNYPRDFKFDLMLSDITMTYCLLPLGQRFNNPPSVGMTALILAPHLAEEFGSGHQHSYLPYLMLRYSDRMNFLERLQNYLWTKSDFFLKKYYYGPKMEAIARKVYGKEMEPLEMLAKRLSLLLCNLSPGFHYPQPLSPNIIPVGGLHIKPTKLPKDLQEIMDNAKHGVILFSLGSNIRSDSLKLEKRNAILKAFSKLDQIILWKFESQLDGLPKNVIIRKWLPQNDILAHPNLKLFISHGGGLSTIEAAFFGIPIVGMPFFVDQHFNIELMVNREMSIKLDYKDLTAESLLGAIQEILHNPKYSQASKEMSSMIRDQPQTPIQRAVFWAEFAMRHNGTHIFDPKSRHLSDFVSSSTDIHLFLLFISAAIIYTLRKIVSLVKSCLWKNATKKLKNQ